MSDKNPVKLMVLVNQLHRKRLERMVEETGLHRAQHRLLMTLSHEKFSSQAELAKFLEVSTATVAVTLKKMEREGVIHKTCGKDDSRVNFVELTDKGREVVVQSYKIFEELDDIALQTFSEEEKDTLMRLLTKLYDNLS